MSINKIYCLGDGFAHGHIWPEWPQILQALVPHKSVIAITGVGAGHEFLISGLLDVAPSQCDVLFQWPQPNRLDKLIEDRYWSTRVQDDPVYFFNTYPSPHGTWWLSSASCDSEVQHYHNKLIQKNQHLRRQEMSKILLKGYLENRQCRYFEFSNSDQETFIKYKYPEFRGTEIQPGPVAHYYYVIERLIPKLGYQIDNDWASELKLRIKNHVWKPYDPDRESIWAQISK